MKFVYFILLDSTVFYEKNHMYLFHMYLNDSKDNYVEI